MEQSKLSPKVIGNCLRPNGGEKRLEAATPPECRAFTGKLIDALEAMRIVGSYKGSKTQDVPITQDQMPQYSGGK
jgi:hypothetical protein